MRMEHYQKLCSTSNDSAEDEFRLRRRLDRHREPRQISGGEAACTRPSMPSMAGVRRGKLRSLAVGHLQLGHRAVGRRHEQGGSRGREMRRGSGGRRCADLATGQPRGGGAGEDRHAVVARENHRGLHLAWGARHGDQAREGLPRCGDRELRAGAQLARPLAGRRHRAGALEDVARGRHEKQALGVPGGRHDCPVASNAVKDERLQVHGWRGKESSAAVARQGHSSLRVCATCEKLWLEHGRPLHLGRGRRGRQAQDRRLRCAKAGHLLQMRNQLAKLVRDVAAHRRRRSGDKLGIRQAAVHGAQMNTLGGACCNTACADLSGLTLSRLGRAVARITGIVGHARSIKQGRVRGTLVHDLNGEAEGQPNPSDQQGDEADLDAEPCRGFTLLPQSAVHIGPLV
mmetsp:Transcript_41876/g.132392  ORF Transcript_41876/g.132392 Transcript_41876/m.132392 type:complete len:401 (+) Transcript_41876:220-1422(+)